MILKQYSAFNKRSAVLSEGVGSNTGSNPSRRADGLGARATPRSGSSGLAGHLAGPGVEVACYNHVFRRFLSETWGGDCSQSWDSKRIRSIRHGMALLSLSSVSRIGAGETKFIPVWIGANE